MQTYQSIQKFPRLFKITPTIIKTYIRAGNSMNVFLLVKKEPAEKNPGARRGYNVKLNNFLHIWLTVFFSSLRVTPKRIILVCIQYWDSHAKIVSTFFHVNVYVH